MPEQRKDARLSPTAPEQLEYVNRIWDIKTAFEMQTQDIWAKTSEYWDMFLTFQQDNRDWDEKWRSNFVSSLPFSTTRTKAAHMVELLGNTEPVWPGEATRESGQWYEQARGIERLLDYTHRMNAWRKFLYKLAVSRSVQGTTWFKIVWRLNS